MTATIITLSEEDLIRLQEILMDQDEKAALAFLRQVVEPEAEKRRKGKCKPPV
ncbi:MAG: hypothetical protein GTO55_10260 [Armatimonadetes bacterium]|nr:hypothetical protein [Armatimonadota bacterium]NIM24621.1 hypothetical protein [Armatimonadota bacterium]NIM68500.1 hypothetical protein [Armatimonadota bacterium]NIM76882.1 hypothetical protein [Armatimonadota bacterium]NIN06694.1 hypothetical protein [Armatimonadota bacterium]